MGFYWGFKGAWVLARIHSKVTVSVSDCLDQEGIFRRQGVIDT